MPHEPNEQSHQHPPRRPSPPVLAEVQALSIPDLVNRYAVGVENFDRRMFDLRDEQVDMAFLSSAGCGRWPVRVLVGHLADAELAFVHRLRRIVAEDHPVFSAWDENAFIDRGLYGTDRSPPEQRQPLGAFVAAVHTLRRWTAEWLRTLEPEDWPRTGLHPERGEQTLRRVLEYATWHVEHHAWYLHAKLDRFDSQPEVHAARSS